MRSCCVLALLSLGACAASRPAGSYDSTEGQSDETKNDLGKVFDQKDAGADARGTDARTPAREDPGDEPEDEADDSSDDGDDVTPIEPVDAEHPLAELAGRYLMRMDLYSTAEATEALTTLRVRNRVSNLFLVQVSTGADVTHVVTRETLCHQVFEHFCEEGCTSWKSTSDPDVAGLFFEQRPVERELAVDGASRSLTAAKAALALGFDELDGENELPEDRDDERVWTLGSGSAERSGLFTRLVAEIPPLISVDCFVSTVQRFVTSFTGTLKASGALSLEDVEFKLTAGTEAAVIWAEGTPTSYCTTSQLNADDAPSGSAVEGMQIVRFARFSGNGCPAAADFDDLLPAKAP